MQGSLSHTARYGACCVLRLWAKDGVCGNYSRAPRPSPPPLRLRKCTPLREGHHLAFSVKLTARGRAMVQKFGANICCCRIRTPVSKALQSTRMSSEVPGDGTGCRVALMALTGR